MVAMDIQGNSLELMAKVQVQSLLAEQGHWGGRSLCGDFCCLQNGLWKLSRGLRLLLLKRVVAGSIPVCGRSGFENRIGLSDRNLALQSIKSPWQSHHMGMPLFLNCSMLPTRETNRKAAIRGGPDISVLVSVCRTQELCCCLAFLESNTCYC